MKPADVVAVLSQEPSRAGVFTDFDGTLAPIVDSPDEARPVPGAGDVLTELARRFAVVGVISGRSLQDVSSRLATSGVVIAGSYGLERSDRPVAATAWDRAGLVEEAAAALSAVAGIVIETKAHGLALHYRLAPEAAGLVQEAAGRLAARHGLELRPGRMVQELTVPGPGKGDALAELAHGLDLLLFAGDDLADLEAFTRARTLPVRSVCVAVASAESPPELVAAADLVLTQQDELLSLFRQLVAATAPRPD